MSTLKGGKAVSLPVEDHISGAMPELFSGTCSFLCYLAENQSAGLSGLPESPAKSLFQLQLLNITYLKVGVELP